MTDVIVYDKDDKPVDITKLAPRPLCKLLCDICVKMGYVRVKEGKAKNPFYKETMNLVAQVTTIMMSDMIIKDLSSQEFTTMVTEEAKTYDMQDRMMIWSSVHLAQEALRGTINLYKSEAKR